MPVDSRKISILLVEDASVMRKIEIKTLKRLGFETILEAEDGQIAMDRLASGQKVDLIISDWNMPNKDGLELLMWIRSDPRFKEIPFLMATGQGDKKQEKKALDAGVSSFVAKPFNQEELSRKIEEAFGLTAEEEACAEAAAPQVSGGGKVRLRVAHIQITDHLILGVLKHLIEKKEVEPKHFELETRCMGGWNPVQQALEKGSVDAAFVLAPIAMDLFSVGAAIKLILLAHKSGSIMVRSKQGDFDPPYTSFFKNKSFYIPHKMSVHHMLAHLFMRKIGLKSGMSEDPGQEVGFEVVAPVKMAEFLKGNPDASGFMVAEPLGTKAIASGIAELQFLSSELWENHPCCVVCIRNDLIDGYREAVQEFTDLLVQAGKLVEKKPEVAAEIGVRFLDPDKQLGLRVPILKNVLSEPKGIKTGDLFPDIESLRQMNSYMHAEMKIGSLIDMDAFVDTRFAEVACKDRISGHQQSVLHTESHAVRSLLYPSEETTTDTDKAMLDLEGKYLTFGLNGQDYGIDILKIKEIVGMKPIRSIPKAPPYVKGVINLRGNVIPIVDLRQRFRMGAAEQTERSCIVVLETEMGGREMRVGLAVDSVSEVAMFKSTDIELTPPFGAGIDTRHILAFAKSESGVKMLLNIDHVLGAEALCLEAA